MFGWNSIGRIIGAACLALALAAGSAAPAKAQESDEVAPVFIPPPVVRLMTPAEIPATAPWRPQYLPEPPGGGPRDPSPRTYPGDWVTPNDYPRPALREELEGTSEFVVAVDASGGVTDCSIVASSGVPLLDEATCRAVSQRARFWPALGVDGAAVSSIYVNSVRWVIPRDQYFDDQYFAPTLRSMKTSRFYGKAPAGATIDPGPGHGEPKDVGDE